MLSEDDIERIASRLRAGLATKDDIARLEQSIAAQPSITKHELRSAIHSLHRTYYAQLIELAFWTTAVLGMAALYLAVSRWVP